jgi:hypothetical protein
VPQQRHGRRGAVFSIRVTDAERSSLEQLQALEREAEGGAPRALGPWLVWRALRRGTPPRPGNTPPAGYSQDRVLPPAEVVPRRSRGYYPSSGTTPAIADRLILDLCGGSGSWSAPYKAAGYRVRTVDLPEDVRTLEPPEDVWGILAAPPCDQFSLARNGHDSPRDIQRGLEVVSACLRLVMACKLRPQPLQWWALENPVGLLSHYLGTPRDVWQPCDFGDPWTKRTAIWGEYSIPERGPFVEPLGGGPLCVVCDPERRSTTWCSNSAHRAITPPGFAQAFFQANP